MGGKALTKTITIGEGLNNSTGNSLTLAVDGDSSARNNSGGAVLGAATAGLNLNGAEAGETPVGREAAAAGGDLLK